MRFVLACCPLFALAIPANATFLFNSLSTNNTVPASISSPGGYQVQGSNFGGPNSVTAIMGAQFTPDNDYTLTEIDLAIGNNGGPGDSNITLEIFSDSGGLPNAQVGGQSWSFVAPSGSFTTVVQVPVSGFHVSANTPYWLVAMPGDTNTTALWALNGLVPSFQGPHADDAPPVQGWTLLNPPLNFFDTAFAIQGILPEPSTGTLCGLAICALAVFSRRLSFRRGRRT